MGVLEEPIEGVVNEAASREPQRQAFVLGLEERWRQRQLQKQIELFEDALNALLVEGHLVWALGLGDAITVQHDRVARGEDLVGCGVGRGLAQTERDAARRQGMERPVRAAEERWSAHVAKMYEIMLMRKAKGWFTGYNSNVDGHEAGKVRYFVYNGGTPKYVGIINGVAAGRYEEITFSSNAQVTADASRSRATA